MSAAEIIPNLGIFLSYAAEDNAFVNRIAFVMKRLLDERQVFTYRDDRGTIKSLKINDAKTAIDKLRGPGSIPVFVQFTMANGAISTGQMDELEDWNSYRNRRGPNADHFEVKVYLPVSADNRGSGWVPPGPSVELPHAAARSITLKVPWLDMASAEWVAERTLRFLLFSQEEIPFNTQLSDYEKSTIEDFRSSAKRFSSWSGKEKREQLERLKQGFPFCWPSVGLRCGHQFLTGPNPLREDQRGKFRTGYSPLTETSPSTSGCGTVDAVVASALTGQHEPCMMKDSLVFLEAGPRSATLSTPVNVGILVSGGIAPGVNAVIDGIVQRHEQYENTHTIYGIRHGFFGLLQWDIGHHLLNGSETSGKATQGGSWLETFRLRDIEKPGRDADIPFRNIIGTLRTQNISILYVIGGDGSMKAAHRLVRYARREEFQLSVVGIPKTMDNDILWVWQSFGFATAVEKAREIIQSLYTELISNPRICFLQLFGSASGFVVSHAVAASQIGHCDIALVPEVKFTIKGVARRLAQKIAGTAGGKVRSIPYGLVVMAEAAIPEDWNNYKSLLDSNQIKAVNEYQSFRKKRQYPTGQTSDELRSAGLKLVMGGVMKEIRDLLAHGGPIRPNNVVIHLDDDHFRAVANEPRHLLRATSPSFADIITGRRLGALAVDNAMAGYTDFMISQWLTEFVLVPLRLVSMGRKHVPEDGIFWKSVLANTGQGGL